MIRASALAPLPLFLLVTVGQAHEMRPGYLEIRETEPDTYDIIWKVPARGINERFGLQLKLADDVQQRGETVGGFRADAHIQKLRIHRVGGLTGSPITIERLPGTFTDVLLRFERLDGSEIAHRLTPDAPTYVVEANPALGQVAWTYFMLGVEHILLGIDHLLFVLALLLIVADWRKLVATITSFTVAHSITLALATLGFMHVPAETISNSSTMVFLRITSQLKGDLFSCL